MNQPDAAAICRSVYGDRLAVVPYVMPGYELSVAAARIAADHPGCEGLWLVNHGLFTFGDTARQSYDRMIEFVNMAEDHIAAQDITLLPGDDHSVASAAAARFVALICDRVLAAADSAVFPNGVLTDARGGTSIATFLAREDLDDIATRGTVTPDHVIRVKPFPLILEGTETAAAIDCAMHDYATRYTAYFETHAAGSAETKVMLDPLPRIVLVRNLGLIGIGKTSGDARIVADLGAQSVRVILAAEARGRFSPLTPAQLFEMEYWSLEQAKLKG